MVNPVVDLSVVFDHVIECELFFKPFVTCIGQLTGMVVVCGGLNDDAREFVNGARGDNPAGFAADHDLGVAPNGGDGNRHRGCHGFQECHGCTFTQARQDKKVHALNQVSGIVPVAGHYHLLR